MPDPNDLSLAELFAESDRVGDKYLTDNEIKTRDEDLAAALSELDAMLKPTAN